MLVIGLTGGIGSGKSTVGREFERLGVPVIDTDDIARFVVRAGQPALERIRERFGSTVVQADGELDRAALRQQVFSDARLRRELEAIVHPRIREELQRRLAALSAPYCIVAIPLLVEKGWQSEVDRVVVVDAPRALQVQRTLKRAKMDIAQAERIIAAQAAPEERLAVADDVIHNDTDLEHLRAAVRRLHVRYLALAAECG